MTDIYRPQAHDSIMCGYFCIGFIEITRLYKFIFA